MVKYLEAFSLAIVGDFSDLFKYLYSLRDKDANEWRFENALRNVAANGNLIGFRKLKEALIEENIKADEGKILSSNLHSAFYAATKGAQIKMIKLLLAEGCNQINSALDDTAENGQLEIVHLLIDSGTKNFDNALRKACSRNMIMRKL